MTNTKMLEDRIDSSGLKKSFIAEELGITRQGFLNKVTNKNEFKAGEIEILCNILSISNKDRIAIFFAK